MHIFLTFLTDSKAKKRYLGIAKMRIFDTFLTDLRAKIAVYGVAKMRIYRHAYRGPQSMAGVLLGLGVGLGLGFG